MAGAGLREEARCAISNLRVATADAPTRFGRLSVAVAYAPSLTEQGSCDPAGSREYGVLKRHRQDEVGGCNLLILSGDGR